MDVSKSLWKAVLQYVCYRAWLMLPLFWLQITEISDTLAVVSQAILQTSKEEIFITN